MKKQEILRYQKDKIRSFAAALEKTEVNVFLK